MNFVDIIEIGSVKVVNRMKSSREKEVESASAKPRFSL